MTAFEIQPIQPEQDAAIARIIRSVGAEYGAIGEGFGPSDAEVAAMSQYYREENASRYLVATLNGEVVGGCGIASFAGSRKTCELKKLFLLNQGRGLGMGKALTMQCLQYAREQGYTQCYLDTLSGMQAAIALYEKLGFVHLDHPLGGTIHGGCDVWMLKNL